MNPAVRQLLMGADSAALAVARAMSTPPTQTRQRAIASLIRGLKNAGAWSSLDALYMRAAADAQASRVDWFNPSSSLTAIASPTLTADKYIAYNGTTQYEYTPSAYRATYLAAVNLPDGPGGDPGKGFTCTGLVRDAQDGTWWVGDDGRHTEAAPGTREAALVNLSFDGSTILGTIDLQTLFASMGTVQGVAYDTSDNTLWFASTDENLIRHVSKAGADLGSIAFTAPNGLAYDAANDCLITIASSGAANTVTWVRCSDGTTLKTKKIRFNTDQLYFDGSDGAEGALYYSVGSNNQVGWVEKIDVATNTWQGHWLLPEATAIEGVALVGSTLYVANDAYFHNGAQFNNQLLSYSVDPLGVGASDRIVLVGTAKYAAAPASTVCLVSGGEPLGGFGLGLYAPLGGTVLRMILTTLSGSSITINWTVTVTDRFTYVLDVNLAAKTAALYVNGSLVSSQAIASAGATLPKMSWFLGAAPDIPVARFSNMEQSLFLAGRSLATASARGGIETAVSNYYSAVGLSVP